jgi:hypothetical protein
MQTNRSAFIIEGAFGILLWVSAVCPLPAQQAAAPAAQQGPQPQGDPLAELSPENRSLFDAFQQANTQGHDADALADGKKLLPSLQPDTRLARFVTQATAEAALNTSDATYASSLLKPIVDQHPDDWRAAALLVRAYAESGEKSLRDQQVARLIDLHKQSSDSDFTKLHTFPIQKVQLRSGYAVFLFPFQPLKPYNTYLVALIYSTNNKLDYRLELGSEDEDQAFFKPKHAGERRFSIDSYRKNETNENLPESQALHGFVDGVFDYDRMRDLMVKTANGEALPKD